MGFIHTGVFDAMSVGLGVICADVLIGSISAWVLPGPETGRTSFATVVARFVSMYAQDRTRTS